MGAQHEAGCEVSAQLARLRHPIPVVWSALRTTWVLSSPGGPGTCPALLLLTGWPRTSHRVTEDPWVWFLFWGAATESQHQTR